MATVATALTPTTAVAAAGGGGGGEAAQAAGPTESVDPSSPTEKTMTLHANDGSFEVSIELAKMIPMVNEYFDDDALAEEDEKLSFDLPGVDVGQLRRCVAFLGLQRKELVAHKLKTEAAAAAAASAAAEGKQDAAGGDQEEDQEEDQEDPDAPQGTIGPDGEWIDAECFGPIILEKISAPMVYETLRNSGWPEWSIIWIQAVPSPTDLDVLMDAAHFLGIQELTELCAAQFAYLLRTAPDDVFLHAFGEPLERDELRALADSLPPGSAPERLIREELDDDSDSDSDSDTDSDTDSDSDADSASDADEDAEEA